MLFDTALYMVLGWYLRNVWPSEFGTRKNPFFCFKPLFRLCFPKKRYDISDAQAERGHYIEQVTPEVARRPGIKIKNIQKDFGSFRAVDISELNMYEDQIFVLLGHNGAGMSHFCRLNLYHLWLRKNDVAVDAHWFDWREQWRCNCVREKYLRGYGIFEKLDGSLLSA